MAKKMHPRKLKATSGQISEAARLFGRMGGKARVARMTPEQRREAARKAVLARWARAKAKKKDRDGAS